MEGPALDGRRGKVYRGGFICCGEWGREGSTKGKAGMAIGKEFGRGTEEGRRGRLRGVVERIRSRRSTAAASSSPFIPSRRSWATSSQRFSSSAGMTVLVFFSLFLLCTRRKR